MRRGGFVLVLMMWLGLGGCAGGPGFRDTVGVGQREADLVARRGQPQEIQPAPGGGRFYIYTSDNLDQTAAMGGGAWVKPDQEYYRLNDQGVITEVVRYPYGKRNFLFPGREKQVQVAQAAPTASESKAPPAAPVPPAVSPPAAQTPAPPAPTAKDAATRLELNLSRAEVQRLLGPPERTEGFRAGNRGIIVWYYLLENQPGRRVLTPLVFEDGRLSGWGEDYYRRRLRETASP
uniref:Outer membrane protein assembly factor BamE n=1 Tax=Desulfobacca acetoxidans TaxID=60893 RepID=A0A7C3V9R8_9BACT